MGLRQEKRLLVSGSLSHPSYLAHASSMLSVQFFKSRTHHHLMSTVAEGSLILSKML